MYYVAFLRGINVGGRVVKMADLTKCLESAGFKDVKTFLQSGNVLFGSNSTNKTELRVEIERAVSEVFHYDAKILVYTLEELKEIIAGYPFEEDEKNQAYIVFLSGDEEELDKAIEAADAKLEKAKEGKGCAYWRVPKGMTLKTTFAEQLNKPKLKSHNTVRNINTLRKITATT